MTAKNILINLAKIFFVLILIWWLISSGKLDFKQLSILLDKPLILLANILIWLIGYLVLGAFRWFLLLRGQGLVLEFSQVLRLQLIGFFFNTAIPGSVGGDIIKGMYVIRGLQSDRKTPAMLTILLDRVVGLSSLFLLAGIAILFNLDLYLANPLLLPLVVFVAVGVIGIVAGFSWILFINDSHDVVARIITYDFPGVRFIRGIYQALRVYRHKPGVIVNAIFIGTSIQAVVIIYAWYLTEAMTGVMPQIGPFVGVFTVGIMTTALPLAPGGVGVGHVAFDRLFHIIGLTGGANVFNVIVLVQLTLNLFGIIPYIAYRSHTVPDENLAPSLTT